MTANIWQNKIELTMWIQFGRFDYIAQIAKMWANGFKVRNWIIMKYLSLHLIAVKKSSIWGKASLKYPVLGTVSFVIIELVKKKLGQYIGRNIKTKSSRLIVLWIKQECLLNLIFSSGDEIFLPTVFWVSWGFSSIFLPILQIVCS